MIKILILKGCDGRYSYCAETAIKILRPHMLPGDFDDPAAALKAAMCDTSIPGTALFTVQR